LIGNVRFWDVTTSDYTKTINNNGIQFPLEQNVEVISVMAGIRANIAYRSIESYTNSIINTFDPTKESDRSRAADIFCPNSGCHISLRIVQGGNTSIYMLALTMDGSTDPLDAKSLKTKALNLRASNGPVTKVEILLIPDSEINDIPSTPTVLHS